jgi:hypothetical protein
MLIFELFNKPVSVTHGDFDPEEIGIKFDVEGIPYQFYAYSYPSSPGTWMVEFTGNATTKIIGTRNEYKVFSTIINIMREMLQTRYVTQLEFSAAEPSRVKLYKRLVSRLLPTWKLSLDAVEGMFIATSPEH